MNTASDAGRADITDSGAPTSGWTRFDVLGGRRITLAQIVFFGFVLELFALALPVFWQLFFDRVMVNRSLGLLHTIGLCMVLGSLFEGLLLFQHMQRIHRVSASVDRSLTPPVMRKLLELPLQFFERRAKGEIAARLREISVIRHFLSATAVSFVIDMAVMALVLGIMAWYNVLLAAVVATCVPILVLLSMYLRKTIQSAYDQQRQAANRFEGTLAEGLSRIGTIKTMALERLWLRRWTTANDKSVDASSDARRLAALEATGLRVVQRLVVLAVLWVGALEFLAGRLSAGQLIACYMFSVRILAPSARMFQVATSYFRYQRARVHLQQLLDEPGEPVTHASSVPFRSGPIRFEHVSFRYAPDAPPVLSEVDLVLDPGTAAGIVGPSGCGKSTMAKLLQRHLVPDTGRITIGGIDVRDVALDSLRRNVVLLTNDAAVFGGTLQANIVGDAPVDETRLRRCCDLAALTPVIAQLPQALDTALDEDAPRLSLGQRQRIALARALYAAPQVLILDEATNGLDTETESLVLRNLVETMTDRTLIVITHRTHLLADFTWVGRIGEGRLVAADSARDTEAAP